MKWQFLTLCNWSTHWLIVHLRIIRKFLSYFLSWFVENVIFLLQISRYVILFHFFTENFMSFMPLHDSTPRRRYLILVLKWTAVLVWVENSLVAEKPIKKCRASWNAPSTRVWSLPVRLLSYKSCDVVFEIIKNDFSEISLLFTSQYCFLRRFSLKRDFKKVQLGAT